MGGVREYLKLIRPYGILFLGFTPVFGALCNGEFNGFRLGILLIIGLLTHIFVFVQNDYYDVDVDKKSKYAVHRPLISGAISKQQALLIFFGAFLTSLALAVLFVFSWAAFFFLLLSFFLMTLYNKFSKRVSAMECMLGTGVFVFGVFGALTVSEKVSPLSLIVSFVGFLLWMFSVGVSANLKDVEYDAKLGIRTTPIVLGVHVINDELKKTIPFYMYALGIQLLYISVASLPFFLGYTSVNVSGIPIPALSFGVLSFVLVYMAFRILSTPLLKRDTLLRYAGVHEGLALLLIPVVLMSYLLDQMGVFFTVGVVLLLLFWPLGILRILFGKRMIPLE